MFLRTRDQKLMKEYGEDRERNGFVTDWNLTQNISTFRFQLGGEHDTTVVELTTVGLGKFYWVLL